MLTYTIKLGEANELRKCFGQRIFSRAIENAFPQIRKSIDTAIGANCVGVHR